MKKLILVLALVTTFALHAQDEPQTLPDTVVTVEAERGGLGGFYDKHSDTIWVILGALGVIGFLTYRAGRLKDALQVVIDAAQDGRVTEAEFQAIVRGFKEVFGKKPK